jgi:hypothetical protein
MGSASMPAPHAEKPLSTWCAVPLMNAFERITHALWCDVSGMRSEPFAQQGVDAVLHLGADRVFDPGELLEGRVEAEVVQAALK